MKDNKPLVSIIVPVYNAEKFLSDTVKSIVNQSYTNWELLLIDDCTPDKSKRVAGKYLKKDKRIKWIKLDKNSGAAIARNRGIQEAKGQYICFLDSDDLWTDNKLEIQLKAMQENDYAFLYTDYEFAAEDGKPNGKIVRVPKTITYNQALKNTIIWISTVMLNMKKLDKGDISMPDLRLGQDTATWWKILKKIPVANGMNEVTAYYRRHKRTLSSNKIRAVRQTWGLYRKVEGIGRIKSCYYFIFYIFNAIRKRL